MLTESITGAAPPPIQNLGEISVSIQGNKDRAGEELIIKDNSKSADKLSKEADKASLRSKEESKSSNKIDFSELASKIKDALKEENVSIEFSLDQETKRMILKVIDSETDEIIKQFPPEITLKIARIIANALESGQVANAKV